jgi:hypothetical protein
MSSESLKAEPSCEYTPSGSQTSGAMRALIPLNPSGATPMMVYGWPFT